MVAIQQPSMMQGEHTKEEEILFSFNVTLLFTTVRTDEAVDVIYRKLAAGEEDLVERTPLSAERMAELLQLCLKSTYFSYKGEFYEQSRGQPWVLLYLL